VRILMLVSSLRCVQTEVRRRDGAWLSVPSARYTFVCNLGDLAKRWTNNLYQSTPHRVLNTSPQLRHSVIFFNSMDADAVVACLPSCVSDSNPPAYMPITCGEYVHKRLERMKQGYTGESQFGEDGLVAEPTEDAVQAAID